VERGMEDSEEHEREMEQEYETDETPQPKHPNLSTANLQGP